MRSFKQPIWQVRYTCFYYFEHAGFINLMAICWYAVIFLSLNLEVMPERGFKAHIIERSHFVSICYTPCI
jgi:hypothetical protein